jgi:hypothetical protein
VLPLKDLCGRSVGEKVTGVDLKVLKELEGPQGGRTWFAGYEGIVPTYQTIIAYWYRMSMITYIRLRGKELGGREG